MESAACFLIESLLPPPVLGHKLLALVVFTPHPGKPGPYGHRTQLQLDGSRVDEVLSHTTFDELFKRL